MIVKMFAVYDETAGCFATPFFATNTAMAQRSFAHAVKDPNLDISRSPHDYTLHELGLFDNESGQLEMQRMRLGTGDQYLPKEA